MGAESVHATGLVGAEVAGELSRLAALVLAVLIQAGPVRVATATGLAHVWLLHAYTQTFVLML